MPFIGCVTPGDCNPYAHGNITQIETCWCGAWRKVNINYNFLEVGPWHARNKGKETE